MSITDENINATLQAYANPLNIQVNALTRLQDSVLDGQVVADGNNVFTFLLEFMSTMTAGAAGEAINAFSGLYPSKAKTSADLYKHMSDFDYVNLYSTPATTKITLMFDRNFLINNAVQDTNNKTYHKIVIPSQSIFKIGTIEFGIHYPIEIIVKKNILPSGAVSYSSSTFTVLWDTTRYTPLHSLKTNVLEHRFYTSGGMTLFCIDIPIHQFSIKTYNESLSSSAGFIRRYTYTDRFYAIRVFHNTVEGWEELHQTLSDTIYDTTIATVKVKVLTDINTVEITIPQVYINNDLIGNKILVKMYTSLGAMNLDISNYNLDQFSASFLINDEVIDTGYSDMLKYISTIQIVPSVSMISGGKNGLTFEELRTRVIHDSIYDVIITPRDLVAYFNDHGYIVSKYLDNITNRIYLAHKVLTDNKNNMIGAGEYNTVITDNALSVVIDADTLEKYVENYSNIKYISDTAYMLLPTNLYKYDEKLNSMVILNDAEVAEINKLGKKDRVKEFNNNLYSYVPFHTKILTGPSPNCISYDLFNPTISNLIFVGENPNIATQASVHSYGISHLNDGSGGYSVYINLYRTDDISKLDISEYSGTKIFKNIIVALVSANKDGVSCYTMGEHIGNNDTSGLPVFQFNINTDYKISDDDAIHITNLKSDNSVAETYIHLTSSFKIMTFIRSGLLDDPTSSMKNVDTTAFPSDAKNYIWLSTQAVDITLGSKIDMLHNNISLTLGDAKAEVYPTTTFATYTRPIYARWIEGESGSEGRVGLIKYPLVELHKPGELILSPIDGHIIPPACKLFKAQPNDIIEISNSEYSNEINGTYYLEDNSSTGIYRKWKKVVNIETDNYLIIENHMVFSNVDHFDTYKNQWKINRYKHGVLTRIYHTNAAAALASPPTTGWVLTNSLANAIVKVKLIPESVIREFNMILSEPYTATSWRNNTWIRDPGDLYLYGCSLPDVNGTYSLSGTNYHGIDRKWVKISNIDGVTITHTIAYKQDEYKWLITKSIDSGAPIKLFFAIDTNAETEPWNDKWVFVKTYEESDDETPPMFYILNYDETEHKIIVEDLLEHVDRQIDDSLIFQELSDVKKYVAPDTMEIVDPVKNMFIFITGDLCGVYIRDQELADFDPIGYLSKVQLYDFFARYDSPEYMDAREDNLAARYNLPKHIVKKILAWRIPWVRLAALNTRNELTTYLHERNINGYPLDRIREIQDKMFLPIKTFKDSGEFDAGVATLEVNEIVWVDNIAGMELEPNPPILGDVYSGGPAGALCIITVSKPALVCCEKSIEHAKSRVTSYGTHSGLMYSIYEKRNSDTFALRYISPLTTNAYGISIDMVDSAWHFIDKWPWDVVNWVDASTGSSNKNVKVKLNDLTSSALVVSKSDEIIVDDDGDIDEDVSTRASIYNASLLHIDYKPTLSSELRYRNYKTKIVDNLRQHFNTLATAKVSLLEQTSLFFKPIRTIGTGTFKYTTDSTIDMRLDMTMDLRLHVEARVMTDAHLREMLEKNIYSIIAKHLSSGSISQTSITKDILTELNDSIVYIDVLGINGVTDLQTLIPVKTGFSPYIKQNLYVKDDGTIGTKSGLNIKWVVVD